MRLLEGQIMEVEAVMVAQAVGGGRLAVCVQEGWAVEEVGVGDELLRWRLVSILMERELLKGCEKGSGKDRSGMKTRGTPPGWLRPGSQNRGGGVSHPGLPTEPIHPGCTSS